jgi:hypothetical protein
MESQESYTLEIHISNTHFFGATLEEKVNDILNDFIEKIALNIYPIKEKDKILYNRIVLNGSLQDIDKCHQKLQKHILSQEPLNFYRYIDEAGDKIRCQAYPILAEIENKIRAFINQAIVDIWEFNWWNSHPPDKIAQKTNKLYFRHKNDENVHPLECTNFEDLIDILTAKFSCWKPEQSITVGDLSNLLNNHHTIDDINTELQKKMNVHSYWDNVFSKYFQNEEQWKKLEKILIKFIIPQRNNVMHHKPMYLGALKALSNKRDEIIKLIDSAKSRLSEEERIKAKSEMEEINAIQQIDAEHAGKLVEDYRHSLEKQIEDIKRSFASSRHPLEKQIEDIKRSFASSQHPLEKQIEDIKRSFASSQHPLEKQIEDIKRSVASSRHLLEKQIEDIKKYYQNSLEKQIEDIKRSFAEY